LAIDAGIARISAWGNDRARLGDQHITRVQAAEPARIVEPIRPSINGEAGRRRRLTPSRPASHSREVENGWCGIRPRQQRYAQGLVHRQSNVITLLSVSPRSIASNAL